ncbi:hypothetical protein ACVWYG_003249 [Pedobacter sp. UYEF25]
MKKISYIFVFVLCSYLPFKAAAWGVLGHRIVGQIAESYLSNKAKKGVKGVLGYESLAIAANWADFIKSDSNFNYLGSWHYVNLAAGLDQSQVFNYLETEKMPNVYNKIPEMIKVLKDKTSTVSQKQLAMRMLVHLVGDLHQPMHTARKDDKGGNNVYVTWFGQKSNLHRIWDSDLVDFQQLSYTEYADAINHLSPIELYNWQHTSLKQDVYESYLLCNQIYAKTPDNAKLSYRYNFDFIAPLNQQLLKAGVRLAKILNDIYS